jgi:hypothetical protein
MKPGFQGTFLEMYMKCGTTVRGLKPTIFSKEERDCQKVACCCMTVSVSPYCNSNVDNLQQIDAGSHAASRS